MRGLLPPYLGSSATTPSRSPYLTDARELVERFGTTPERRAILQGFLAYRRLLATLGYHTGFQLVDGSFVENIEGLEQRPPGDVDVFSFLDLPRLGVTGEALDDTGKENWTKEIADRDNNKARFKLDSYAALLTELDFVNTFLIINYWTSLFSHRRVTAAWKGFLAVPLDAATDDLAQNELNDLEAAYA